MASLSSLYRQLSNEQEKVSEFEREIRMLEERLKDVKKVKRNLSSVASHNASDVNSKIVSAEGKLFAAINYAEKRSQFESIFDGKKESDVDEDINLASADSDLKEEIRKVERDLGIAESNLVNSKNKVSSIKSSIAAEKRRQREERERRRRRRRERARASS